MSFDAEALDQRIQQAVVLFWSTRTQAAADQLQRSRQDQGERAGVTNGKNMDGFASILYDVAIDAKLEGASISVDRGQITLPGHLRATKQWDVVVMRHGKLLAAIECKSHIGPSFGNNFNNRTEEAIGTATDFWAAYDLGYYGRNLRERDLPWMGWFMYAESMYGPGGSRHAVAMDEPHFPAHEEFATASYIDRYEILCRRLEETNLYANAALMTSERHRASDGQYLDESLETCFARFVWNFDNFLRSRI